jgi:glycine cleavage system H lipoate-binding protein
MSSVIDVLQSAGVFVVGLATRFGMFLAMLALLVLPALLAALVIRAAQARKQRALGLRTVAGVLFRPGAAYAPGHTWLAPRKGGALTLGIDDIAERLLPAVTAVDLPRAGTSVARGDVVATLHGGGREVKIRAPIPGVVAGVNASVVRNPALVKSDFYGAGWLVALAPADGSFAALPQGDAAEGWLRKESARWTRYLEERLGFAAADGGELLAPAPWLIGEEGWRALASAFLTV